MEKQTPYKVVLKTPQTSIPGQPMKLIDIANGTIAAKHVSKEWQESDEAFGFIVLEDYSRIVVELNRGNGETVNFHLNDCLAWLKGQVKFGNLTHLEAAVLSSLRRFSDGGAADQVVCDELRRIFEESTVDEGVNQIVRKINQQRLMGTGL